MLLKTFIVLASIGICLGAQAGAKLPEIPEKFASKVGCYIKANDEVIDFGTNVTKVGSCTQIYCSQNGLLLNTCGPIGTSGNCHITEEDLTKKYPECCPQIECP